MEDSLHAQLGVQREDPWYKMDVSELLAADICAAAQWIIHAGGWMWKDDRPDDPEFIQRVLPGKSDLWEGSPGLTEGRWHLWKDRFSFMAIYVGISQDAREVARQAAEIMGEFP